MEVFVSTLFIFVVTLLIAAIFTFSAPGLLAPSQPGKEERVQPRKPAVRRKISTEVSETQEAPEVPEAQEAL